MAVKNAPGDIRVALPAGKCPPSLPFKITPDGSSNLERVMNPATHRPNVHNPKKARGTLLGEIATLLTIATLSAAGYLLAHAL
jgi:hypothetical protein